MKESELERIFVNEVRKEGGEAYKFISPGNSGVPDRIVVFPWEPVCFVELKADDGTLSPAQAAQIRRLRALKQEVFVVKGVAGLIRFFDNLGGHGDAAARLRKRFRVPEGGDTV